MKKFAVAAALMLWVAACSSSSPPMTSRWWETYGSDFPQPKPGEAALYIVRDVAPAGAPPVNLSIGRRPMGGLAGMTWMRFDLEPRLYDLRAFGPDASSELIITVAPGQTRFMLVELKDPGSAEILEISGLDGRRLVRQGQHTFEMGSPAEGP